MNIFLIVISAIILNYIIAYFLTRSAILRCDSRSDIESLHVIFFIPVINIITPLIALVMSIGAYDFFRIKK